MFLQHSHFCNYISQNGNPGLAARVRRLKPCYLSMPWQTTKNSIDCGIFLMRHMETFKGDHKNWNNELVEEGVRLVSLIILCIIILSDVLKI